METDEGGGGGGGRQGRTAVSGVTMRPVNVPTRNQETSVRYICTAPPLKKEQAQKSGGKEAKRRFQESHQTERGREKARLGEGTLLTDFC